MSFRFRILWLQGLTNGSTVYGAAQICPKFGCVIMWIDFLATNSNETQIHFIKFSRSVKMTTVISMVIHISIRISGNAFGFIAIDGFNVKSNIFVAIFFFLYLYDPRSFSPSPSLSLSLSLSLFSRLFFSCFRDPGAVQHPWALFVPKLHSTFLSVNPIYWLNV